MVEARPAATILLLREAAGGMEVFMVKRHHQIDFASGALVFPGGSVDQDDRTIVARPHRLGTAEARDEDAMTLCAAAIRETFEECGILLARPRGASALVTADRLKSIEAAHRPQLAARETKLSDMLEAEDLVLASDLLVPFAHWITPAGLPKRFDTHFFLALAPPDQLALHDGQESVDSFWIAPRQALTEAENGRYTIIFPTRLNLEKLGRARTAEEAIAAARRERIVTVMPQMSKTDGGFRMVIPAEAGYGGPVFDIKRL